MKILEGKFCKERIRKLQVYRRSQTKGEEGADLEKETKKKVVAVLFLCLLNLGEARTCHKQAHQHVPSMHHSRS